MTWEAAEATDADRRVHPATVPLRFLKEAPSALLGLPAGFAFLRDEGLGAVLGFALVVAAGFLVYHWLAWRNFRYGIGGGDIVIESGILARNRRSIPFARIQDVDIERGPLQRLFGLARLRIETGGSAGEEGLLDSVALAEAERLRAALRAARAGAKPEPARDGDRDRGLFAMQLPRVLAAGLFNFSLVWIAGLFALLQTFERLLPFDIYDPGRWIGLVGTRLEGRFTPSAILAVGLLALVLGIVTGVARTLSRDFGFRLALRQEGFRVERGLFTRVEFVIPPRRVQLAFVQTGPLRRALGFYGLSFQNLGGGRPGQAGRQSVAPFARKEEIERVLAAHPALLLPKASLQPVSSRSVVRRLGGLTPLLLLIVAAGMADPRAWFALAALPFLVALALFQRRFHRWAVEGEVLFVDQGVWRQRRWIVPLASIQSLRLSRSFLQRRLGLASLWVDTAGAPLMDSPGIIDLRHETARLLAKEVLPHRP